MRILAITSRDLEKGSTKYRLAQYLEYFSRQGMHVEFVRRDEVDHTTIERARNVDVVFNQKCLISCSLAKRLIAASRRVIFDFDDAIYTRPGKPFSWLTQQKINRRFHLWLKKATTVTTANEFLANYARNYSSRTEIVPMALDLNVWRPVPREPDDHLIIGWAGAPINVPLLERLDGVLCTLLERHPSVRLAVFSGKKPNLHCPFDYYPFRPGAESQFVAGLDIGLLPLADEEYTRGKSPIKALQYLACGVPVVGNVYGATAEIVNERNGLAVSKETDWLPVLERLISAPDLAQALGKAGREMVVRQHDLHAVAAQFQGILAG